MLGEEDLHQLQQINKNLQYDPHENAQEPHALDVPIRCLFEQDETEINSEALSSTYLNTEIAETQNHLDIFSINYCEMLDMLKVMGSTNSQTKWDGVDETKI